MKTANEREKETDEKERHREQHGNTDSRNREQRETEKETGAERQIDRDRGTVDIQSTNVHNREYPRGELVHVASSANQARALSGQDCAVKSDSEMNVTGAVDKKELGASLTHLEGGGGGVL